MSLLPNEQRALAAIEDSLLDSDPGLAAMLATFTLPPAGRLIVAGKRLARPLWARRLTRGVVAIAVTIAVIAICLIVASL